MAEARVHSDGGTMIVGRRTANWTFGQFEVVLPVGEDAAPRDARIADGYIYRPDDRETSRFSLTFVRADVKIDMNAEKSDLEATLDTASRRVDGAVYYSREISGPGLGRAVPGVDYTTGDMVEVVVWSTYMDLVCSGIRYFSTVDNPLGVSAVFGGDPLRDPEGQRKRVSELHTQIMTEQARASEDARRLSEQQERDRELTRQAQSAAERADSAAAAAQRNTRTLRSTQSSLASNTNAMNDQLDSMNHILNACYHLVSSLLDGVLASQQQTAWDQANKAWNDLGKASRWSSRGSVVVNPLPD